MKDPIDGLIQDYERQEAQLSSELVMVQSRLAGLRDTKAKSAFPMPPELKGVRRNKGGKRRLSDGARRKISEAVTARWATYRKERDGKR